MVASQNREIELKYAVDDPEQVRQLLEREQLGGLVPGPWREVSVSDRYLDTASRSIEKAGYGARLRHMGRNTVLTVKSAESASGGAGARTAASQAAKHDRLELEGRASRGLDPQAWPQSAARSVVETAAGGERLRTMFTIDQRRLERDLCRADGSVAAVVSLDEAQVSRLGRSVGAFTMLEVELAADAAAEEDPDAAGALLDEVANELESSGLLRPEAKTKEHLGLAMLKAHARSQARPPAKPGILADDPLAEAGRKVLRLHLLRMLQAENGSRDGDVESVKKMRVATRRMRAAWRVFNGAYKQGLQRRYVGELRQVAQTLGAVRDMDVQLERLRDYAAAGSNSAAIESLIEEWQRRRDDAREVLLDLLESKDYEAFVGDYTDFVEEEGAGALANGPGLVREAAAGRIWRAYERLRTYYEIVPYADVPTLHGLRIDAKRMRYTLEFFGEVLPASSATLVAELTAVQDHLGLMNDAQIAANLTRAWLMERAAQLPIETRRAVGAYLNAAERDVERMRRSFGRPWRTVMSRTFRRRLALAIGEV
jgi:CHAD domain-containing protein